MSYAYCTYDDCDLPHFGRGLCVKHYRRLMRHGDPAVALKRGPKRRPATYGAVHARIVLERGKASAHTCPCGAPAQQWAFDEPTGFSEDLSRYTAKCRPCHIAFDRKVAA